MNLNMRYGKILEWFNKSNGIQSKYEFKYTLSVKQLSKILEWFNKSNGIQSKYEFKYKKY